MIDQSAPRPVYLRRTIAALAASLLLCGALGCQPVGTLWYTAFGNPAVPAVYTPPKMPTLVLVENSHRTTDDFDADIVASQVAEELKQHKICPLVDSTKIQQLRDTNPQQYLSMSIADLARTVGAKQVVYVVLQDANAGPDLEHPGSAVQAAARVRVVDVANGMAAWPVDNQAGYPVTADVPFDAGGTQSSDAHTQVLAKLSDSIAKLFYPYSPDNSDDDPIDKPHVMQDM